MTDPAPTSPPRLFQPEQHAPPDLRARAARLIHHPVTDMVVVTLILVAVASLLAEAAFPQGSPTRLGLELLGDLCSGLFVLELSIRFWVAPRKLRFFRRYWLDIVAVLPLARPLRLLRVLVLLRLFRAGVLMNRRLAAYSGVLRGTLNELTIVATLSITIVLVGAVSLRIDGEHVKLLDPTMQGTLEGALWYAVMTLIGGEPILGSPSTELGHAVTLALMLGGMTVFGMFIGTVSATMSTVLSRRLGGGDMELDELSEHIVVCGWNPAGSTMLRELFTARRQRPVVIVTEHPERPEDLPTEGVRPELIYHHRGDYTRVEVLEAVGIKRASSAILLTDTGDQRSDQDRDARTVLAALTIERMHPGIFCCAELINGEHASLLEMANVEEVVVRDWYAGVIIGSMGRNRGLAVVLNDILTTESGNAFHKVTLPRSVEGRSIGELHNTLKADHGAILVSWERHGNAAEVQVNPPPELKVEAGDVLVVIADGPIRLR
jgi:voltage-gated potassium channel